MRPAQLSLTVAFEPQVDSTVCQGPVPEESLPEAEPSATELSIQWPFIQVAVAADRADLDAWVAEDFGSDRDLHQKGVVEVML